MRSIAPVWRISGLDYGCSIVFFARRVLSLHVNPYIAGRAISSARGFCGSRRCHSGGAREFQHTDRNAVVLFGQRRIGKTSILLNLRSRLSSPQFVTVYVDLMDRARQPLNQVLFKSPARLRTS